VDSEILLDFGKTVARRLEDRIKGQTVTLYFVDGKIEQDAFGRYLAYIYVNGRDVSEWMLEEGLVWARAEPHPKSSIYKSKNRQAKSLRVGVYGIRKR
jgi:endonuclease YncB( thermonuclease family)